MMFVINYCCLLLQDAVIADKSLKGSKPVDGY